MSFPSPLKRKSRVTYRMHVNAEEKTALVLSAGGMFGSYQAGVWDVLSTVYQPDIVVGASVGSLNGRLIAGGCTGPELVDRWLNLHVMSELRWRMPNSLTDGILDSSRLVDTIQEMCAGYHVQTEFGVVLTELKRMRPTLFRAPDIRWKHIAASCSVPFILPQYQIDGNYYTDGGLMDPLPVWAALEMGATRIVAVNLLKTRSSWIKRLVQGVQLWSKYSPPGAGDVEIIEITPENPLGSAWDSMCWTSPNTSRWIDMGRTDCEAALTSVVKYGIRDNLHFVPGENSQGCPSTAFTA
ncbi:MAG: patatin-like phospholipase family protein [Bryobacteraceae bacterium]|nr:patatin-like phospholipase family protein [Bryobacteraceae bacterium]